MEIIFGKITKVIPPLTYGHKKGEGNTSFTLL